MIYTLLGGTGTLGTALTHRLLREEGVHVRIMARGEHRLAAMGREFQEHSRSISLFVGDIRDKERVKRAIDGSDVVVLMAALKHVEVCEYNVLEAIKTNIYGAVNVIEAALDVGVGHCLIVSSDKAVEPTTLYGSTKMNAERLFVHAPFYTPQHRPVFYAVRYGNVLGSQGSILQVWSSQLERGEQITISNPKATRFWWRIEEAVEFLLQSVQHARPGDVFVPWMYSCSLLELAQLLVGRSVNAKRIDPYRTEKEHEVLLAPHEYPISTWVEPLRAIRVAYHLPSPPNEPECPLELNSLACCNLEEVAKRCRLDL